MMKRKKLLLLEFGIVAFMLFLAGYVMVPKFLKAQNINLPSRIPDPEFRRYLEHAMKVGVDEPFSAEEAAALTELSIGRSFINNTLMSSNIKSVEGIQYFTGLESLSFYDLSINLVDLSAQTALQSLTITNSPLQSIDLSMNSSIRDLTLSSTEIDTIEASCLSNLEKLECPGNQLRSLDLSDNPEIIWLNCRGNEISELDLSQNHKLEFLEASLNPLEDMDLSHNPELQNIRLNHCNISRINISNITKINNLEMSLNFLDEIPPLKNQPELKYLDLRSNNLDCGDMEDILYYRKRLGMKSILILPQEGFDLADCEGY